jgi:peroxiredoxin
MGATKKSLGIVFAVAIVSLLMKVSGFAQEQKLWSSQDLLRKLKLVHLPGDLPAPRFNASTPEGTKISIDDLKGKLVLLNFWATWCPPCILEMPTMEKLHQEFKEEGLKVVAMNFMEGPKTINTFIKKRGFTFTVLMDRSGEISQRYGVRAIPVTYLIGREGNMLVKSIGYKDWYKKEIRQFVSSLLKDEGIIDQGIKVEVEVEVETGFWPGDRQRQILIIGLAVLVLLLVSTLWFKKSWLGRK